MAVSFNIPKSPKRDIFVIDEFQGVDLTNTETSVDENKSPNAENMVRLVPGKVRKRTGYKTRVIFSDGTDVNRVINSSDKYVDIDVSQMGDTPETGIVIAQFYDIIPPNSSTIIRFETEGCGTYQFVRYPNPAESGWLHTYTPEHSRFNYWSNYASNTEGTQDIRVYRVGDAQDGDYLKVRKVILCTKASTFAKDMEWRPAPEDNGGIYVKRTSIDPIYGCHILKTYDTNRVVNVNRALATSDAFETFTIDDSNWGKVYDLAEQVYCSVDGSIRTPLYVEFDYICDNPCTLSITGTTFNTKLEDTAGVEKHYSRWGNCGAYGYSEVSLKADSGTANVQIKNLSIMYQKDSDYVWRPAPEDNGGTFHIEDVYDTLPINYAINEEYYYADDSSSLAAIADIPIGNAASGVIGFGHISFDLETSVGSEISQIIVRIMTDANQHEIVYEETFTDNIFQHFDWYGSTYYNNRYFEKIQVEFQLANTDSRCLAYAKNIEVKQIQLRPEYTIFSKNYLYHVGREFWLYTTVENKVEKVYSDANQARSQSWQLNDKLVILDGKNIFLYEFGQALKSITSGIGYIPTITRSKNPTNNQGEPSGGTSFDALNLVQPAFIESFVVTEDTKTYAWFNLSLHNLDAKNFIVEVLDENGNWVKQTLNQDYYQNFSNGYVFFLQNHYPGVSPVPGEDNVRITAYKTIDGYADRITKCTVGTLFGVGGAANRLFLSGNPDHPNWDFYSGQFDPTYFPDTGYSVLGSASSAIVGYATVNNYLATFKDEYDPAQNVTIREGDLITDDNGIDRPAFKIINTLQGNGAVAPYSFAYLQTEPLFLTRSGICAITPQDITGERYSQNRSFYLNGKLTKESDLEDAVAVIFNDQYVLALNRKLYILDGLQPMRTDKSMPYSTRQYAGFYCTNVPASCIWVDDQALWIGTYNGKVCRFDNDIESLESYNDDGEPIYCCWETPDLDGRLFYKNKTFRYFAIRIMNALRTSCGLLYKKPSIVIDEDTGEEIEKAWTLIKKDAATGTIFDFNFIDFARFSFNTDMTAKVVHAKVRVKKVDKAQFKIENDAKNEPFGLFDLALEYIESGNYKG